MKGILSDSPKPHPAIKDFTPEQWDEIIDKLMGFTYRYFEARFEGNIMVAQTPDGSTYKDIAQEIVLRVLQGVRRWNPDKDGELLPYMAGQVKSLVDHGFKSWDAKNIESMDADEEGEPLIVSEATQHTTMDVEEPQLSANAFALKRKQGEIDEQDTKNQEISNFIQLYISPNPELVLIGKEYQIGRDQLLDTVLEAVDQSKDDDLWALTEAYLDDSGEYKPREIASRLGISTPEFHSRRKKLIRCVKKYLSEQTSEMGRRDER